MNDPRPLDVGARIDPPSDEEIAAMYREGRSLRGIVDTHPRLSYRRVRGILAASGELRSNHEWRSLTGRAERR
jgi:hypothetical protein